MMQLKTHHHTAPIVYLFIIIIILFIYWCYLQVLRIFSKMMQLKNSSSHCNLRIISINDVYELINFPSLHNLIKDHKVDNTIENK
jgi:hypothetical protein